MAEFQNIRNRKQRPTNLEIADQMFKDAFLVKKTRFSHLHPELSDEDLNKMTAEPKSSCGVSRTYVVVLKLPAGQ